MRSALCDPRGAVCRSPTALEIEKNAQHINTHKRMYSTYTIENTVRSSHVWKYYVYTVHSWWTNTTRHTLGRPAKSNLKAIYEETILFIRAERHLFLHRSLCAKYVLHTHKPTPRRRIYVCCLDIRSGFESYVNSSSGVERMLGDFIGLCKNDTHIFGVQTDTDYDRFYLINKKRIFWAELVRIVAR